MIKLIQEFNQLDNSQQIYFLSLIEESFLLLEGIKSAREKYLDEIGEDKFNELIEIDPSKNKKYLDWICKEYINNVDLERLKDDIKLFDEKCNKNLIQNKDIYSYDNIDELEDILSQSPDISNTERKKEIKKNPNKEEIEILPDIDVLRNDDKYFIAEIHSWEDAKFYGKGTKWCISEKDNDGYWEKYYEDDEDKFIYVRDFQYPNLGINSNINYKLMIQIPYKGYAYIYNKNDKINYSNFECNIWNAKDWKYPTNILEISEEFGLNPEDIVNANIINLSRIDFNTKEGIEEWLDAMEIKNYTINDDLTVDVNGDVDLYKTNLSEIPVQFGKVNGYFSCADNNLKSLKGAPEESKYFNCSYNNLESLEGAPKEVKYFDCSYNNLESLEGAPKLVGETFNCANNNLKSLKGAPEIVKGDFDCSFNLNLKSLEYSPKVVNGNFDCAYDNLKSLEGAPEEVRDFDCSNNNLKSLEGAPEEVRDFDCSNNNLESLEGSPGIVNGNFMCYDNNLESLEGHPKYVGENFNCKNNPELSIRYLDNFDFSFVNGDVHYK